MCKEAATYSTLGLFSLPPDYIWVWIYLPSFVFCFFSIDRKVPKLFNIHQLK